MMTVSSNVSLCTTEVVNRARSANGNRIWELADAADSAKDVNKATTARKQRHQKGAHLGSCGTCVTRYICRLLGLNESSVHARENSAGGRFIRCRGSISMLFAYPSYSFISADIANTSRLARCP